jgi:hypothetical protein
MAGLYAVFGKLPLVKLIRVPSRFILPAAFALSVLATYGLAALQQRLTVRGAKVGATVLAVLALLFAVESAYAPLHLYPLDKDRPPEVYKWLARQEGDFAVMEFPVDPRGYAQFARQVYNSIYHWKRLIIGYSGFQSRENVERLRRLNDSFPRPACISELQTLDVRYVIVFPGRMEVEKLRDLEAQTRLQEVERFGGIIVYEISPVSR